MDVMNKEINFGDRIFARLTMGGKVIMEFMINHIAGMNELLDEVRRMTGSLRGLGRLQVRNQSQGWLKESNLMFYGDGVSNESNLFGRVNANSIDHTIMKRKATTSAARQMMFPWETH